MVCSKGEVVVNQARRGYEIGYDEAGRISYNPFYMKYSPAPDGTFDGQRGYGYVSLSSWVEAA